VRKIRRYRSGGHEFKSSVQQELGALTKSRKTLGVSAGILEKSIRARNRVGIGLLYQPTGIHRLGSLKL
jgi:hypothetical protein